MRLRLIFATGCARLKKVWPGLSLLIWVGQEMWVEEWDAGGGEFERCRRIVQKVAEMWAWSRQKWVQNGVRKKLTNFLFSSEL